nr:flagellar hook-length control protein FliK [uncultured Holophaga sp.]
MIPSVRLDSAPAREAGAAASAPSDSTGFPAMLSDLVQSRDQSQPQPQSQPADSPDPADGTRSPALKPPPRADRPQSAKESGTPEASGGPAKPSRPGEEEDEGQTPAVAEDPQPKSPKIAKGVKTPTQTLPVLTPLPAQLPPLAALPPKEGQEKVEDSETTSSDPAEPTPPDQPAAAAPSQVPAADAAAALASVLATALAAHAERTLPRPTTSGKPQEATVADSGETKTGTAVPPAAASPSPAAPQIPLQPLPPDGDPKPSGKKVPTEAIPTPSAPALPLQSAQPSEPPSVSAPKSLQEPPRPASELTAQAGTGETQPLRSESKAKSTQDGPSIQTAEALLGLKAPAPKPALTELLSRPAPTMEVPRVLQSIQEAKNAQAPSPAAGVQTASPAAAPATFLGSSALALGAGRESEGGTGREVHSQLGPIEGPAAGTPSPQAMSLGNPEGTQRSLPSTATQPETQLRPSVPMQQMEGTVKWMVRNQENTAELQLRPESLGKLQIQLKVEGNQVHAKVWATEPATIPLLNTHREQLESSLRQQGLSLGSFDLHQGQGSPYRPMDQPAGQASTFPSSTDKPSDITPEVPDTRPAVQLGSRRVEVFA